MTEIERLAVLEPRAAAGYHRPLLTLKASLDGGRHSPAAVLLLAESTDSVYTDPMFGDMDMAKKQTGDKVSKLASDVLAGRKKPTSKETKRLAASALSQDEKKGPRGK